MSENELSYIVRGCAFTVYNLLGPGLLESAYEAALKYELNCEGIDVKSQVAIPMVYKDIKIDVGYRLDLVVENKLIIEVKSVEQLMAVHHKQLITYLKLTNMKLGLLINFNCDDISRNIHRKVNNL